jgi:hypothetical protein
VHPNTVATWPLCDMRPAVKAPIILSLCRARLVPREPEPTGTRTDDRTASELLDDQVGRVSLSKCRHFSHWLLNSCQIPFKLALWPIAAFVRRITEGLAAGHRRDSVQLATFMTSSWRCSSPSFAVTMAGISSWCKEGATNYQSGRIHCTAPGSTT